MAARDGSRLLYWGPATFLVALLVTEGFLVAGQTDRHLTYTLDDPYIHLTLAKNLWRGTHGINPGEFSAPSSSILWPFLLAPFSSFRFFHWTPLVFNAVAALATVLLFSHLLKTFPICIHPAKKTYIGVISICALVLVSNQVGLVFSGMEHTLQVFAATAVLVGLAFEVRNGRPARLLTAALVLAPLVRYENLAVSVPALGYLAFRGHWREAVGGGVSLLLVLVSYSAFLMINGHTLVPTSVVAKSVVIREGGAPATILAHAFENLKEGQATLLGLGAVVLIAFSFSRRVDVRLKLLAGSIAASVLLHIAVGRFGWYHRYEIYIYTYAVIGILYLFRGSLSRLLNEQPRWVTTLLIAASTAALGHQYIADLESIPKACRNVYLQQYQMARFVSEFYKKPVAVNDLGLVGLESTSYVLDLWGIGSKEALEKRMGNKDPRWIVDLTTRHDVELAMLYDVVWSRQLPRTWSKIGTLSFQGDLVSVSGRHVSFYAVQPRRRADIAKLTALFAETLPEGATFAFHQARR